jgi:hypothetical protein
MQLIEYFLWNNQVCNETNVNTTKLGVIINHLEPIVLWISILLFSAKELPDSINIFMILFLIVTYAYTKFILSNDDNKCSLVTPESSPHILWKWNNAEYGSIYYAFFLLSLILLSINGLEKGNQFALSITLLFLVSNYLYSNKKSVGSIWCFLAALSPWAIPYIYKL